MRNPLKVEVIQGQIVVESVNVQVRRRGLLVLVVNTDSKYPDSSLSYADNSEPAVHLFATERTLKTKPDAPASMIVLPRYTRGWHVMSDHRNRYSVMIVAWKSRRNEFGMPQVWRSEIDDAGDGDSADAGSDTGATG